jgi:hypothetical protein
MQTLPYCMQDTTHAYNHSSVSIMIDIAVILRTKSFNAEVLSKGWP